MSVFHMLITFEVLALVSVFFGKYDWVVLLIAVAFAVCALGRLIGASV